MATQSFIKYYNSSRAKLGNFKTDTPVHECILESQLGLKKQLEQDIPLVEKIDNKP